MMSLVKLATLVLLLSACVNAQTIRSSNPKTRKNENNAEVQQRRATAISLLQSLAVEARSYSDEPLRARVQAQIADALWNHDKEAARTLFRRAWDIAEALDQAGSTSNSPGRRPNEGRRSQPRANLRREVLKLASRRDHALGQEFQAMDVSKTFRADAPRALATIAVARAVLE